MHRAALALSLIATPVSADWHCRNNALEIACHDGRCASTSSFTPMDVSLADNGRLSVCAYSGCFVGPAILNRRGDFLLATGLGLIFETPAGAGRGDFNLTINIDDNYATLNGMGYANPMICEAGTP